MLLEACELTRTERSASKSVRCSQTHQGFVLTEGLDCHRIPGHQQELHRGQCGGGDPGGTQKGSRRYQGLLEEGPSSAPALPRVPRTRWGCVPQAHRFLWTHCGGGGWRRLLAVIMGIYHGFLLHVQGINREGCDCVPKLTLCWDSSTSLYKFQICS